MDTDVPEALPGYLSHPVKSVFFFFFFPVRLEGSTEISQNH